MTLKYWLELVAAIGVGVLLALIIAHVLRQA